MRELFQPTHTCMNCDHHRIGELCGYIIEGCLVQVRTPWAVRNATTGVRVGNNGTFFGNNCRMWSGKKPLVYRTTKESDVTIEETLKRKAKRNEIADKYFSPHEKIGRLEAYAMCDEVAEISSQEIIDNACEWLKENDYKFRSVDELLEGFAKAMKGE